MVLDVITTVDVSTLLAGYNIVDPATGSLVPNLVLDLETITDIEGMVLQCSFHADTVEWQCNSLTFCTELQFVPDLTRWRSGACLDVIEKEKELLPNSHPAETNYANTQG